MKDSELKVLLDALRQAEKLAAGRLHEVANQQRVAQEQRALAREFIQTANALQEQIVRGDALNAKKDAAFESLFCALADIVMQGKASEQALWDAASKALNEGSAFRSDCK